MSGLDWSAEEKNWESVGMFGEGACTWTDVSAIHKSQG